MRRAIASVGRCSISLTRATRTGVTAAAIGVPPAQNCETTIAAVADAMLAIASVRSDRRRCASLSRLRGGEDIAPEHSEARLAVRAPGTGPEERTRTKEAHSAEPTRGQARRLPCDRRSRAGRADRTLEGSRERGWPARAHLARGGRDPRLQPPRPRRQVQGRQDRRRGQPRRLRRAGAA